MSDCQIPLIVLNINSLELKIYKNDNVKEVIAQFCYQNNLQQRYKEVYQFVKQKTFQMEESQFSRPKTSTGKKENLQKLQSLQEKLKRARLSKENEDLKECTFRPTILNITTPFQRDDELPAYQRLFNRSKIENECKFSFQNDFTPYIIDKSRKLAEKREQEDQKDTQKTSESGNKRQVTPSRKVERKYAIQRLALIHCIFLMLDEDDDNLLSFDKINWKVLNCETGKMIYPILKGISCECNLK